MTSRPACVLFIGLGSGVRGQTVGLGATFPLGSLRAVLSLPKSDRQRAWSAKEAEEHMLFDVKYYTS